MLKYGSEQNWASNNSDLRRKYNLPLKDENISDMSKPVWKSTVKRQIQYYASKLSFGELSKQQKNCSFEV